MTRSGTDLLADPAQADAFQTLFDMFITSSNSETLAEDIKQQHVGRPRLSDIEQAFTEQLFSASLSQLTQIRDHLTTQLLRDDAVMSGFIERLRWKMQEVWNDCIPNWDSDAVLVNWSTDPVAFATQTIVAALQKVSTGPLSGVCTLPLVFASSVTATDFLYSCNLEGSEFGFGQVDE